ncbi:hypothetical protein LFT44_13000 [Arthrobacter sp. FW306-05-C]|uniref:hypothetical protein n=1 Tax=Arthrobacter sp. FW306-05-C TaxID=2879620 RepID=UPI001F163822|nr:hypothetical protein [Arthrobacter sp. FW306-05-C]UKA65434.1 hypothetical protein LFT44_13000 [Arthrobacter sp. FW306-05-C]
MTEQPTRAALTLNRLALALFRAESVEDADALAVLQGQIEALPETSRETLEKMLRNIVAAAQAAPAGVGPEEFFDHYSAALDRKESELGQSS